MAVRRLCLYKAPLERLELSLSAPEADALSTELQGRTKKFYHTRYAFVPVLIMP